MHTGQVKGTCRIIYDVSTRWHTWSSTPLSIHVSRDCRSSHGLHAFLADSGGSIFTPHTRSCSMYAYRFEPALIPCCVARSCGVASPPHSMLHARDLFLLSADPRCLVSSYKAQNMLLIAPIAYKVDRKTCVHRIFFHTTAKDARIEYGTCE